MTNPASSGLYAYVSTYAEQDSPGIHVLQLDPGSGALSPVHATSGIQNPSYLVVDAQGRYLYAVEECNGGGVFAFRIDPTSGSLHLLNRQPSHGDAPCHITISPDGRFVLVANYTSGSIAVLPIQSDGSLGPATSVEQHVGSSVDPDRQEGPHAHWIDTTPDGNHLLVADLGLDMVLVYTLNSAGSLTAHPEQAMATEPGAGPRHLAFAPNGRFAYVINELSSTITACGYDGQHGVLQPLQTLSTLPADFAGSNTTAAVRVAPSGRFVYGSNRGHDSIARFAVDEETGQLRALGHTSTQGKTPRDFNIDPSGQWLFAANQESDTIVTFRVDEAEGDLVPTGKVHHVLRPVSITFSPSVAA